MRIVEDDDINCIAASDMHDFSIARVSIAVTAFELWRLVDAVSVKCGEQPALAKMSTRCGKKIKAKIRKFVAQTLEGYNYFLPSAS